MKSNKLVVFRNLILGNIFFMISLISCNKQEEVFSCDENINLKVKEFRILNQHISRAELSSLEDLDYQMGIFLSLSPENKVSIFKEKINLEMNSGQLNTNEKSILRELIHFLKPLHYSTQNAEFKSFAAAKEKILRESYGWDDAKVFIFTNSWMLASEIETLVSQKLNVSGSSQGGGQVSNMCSCYYGYYCWLKGGEGTCEPTHCKISSGGCGVFGTTNCDGKCK